MRRLFLISTLALFINPVLNFGQTAKPTPPPISEESEVIRVDTELIDVPVTVTDRQGRPVTGLKRSNFVVFEDSKPQEIAEFAATTSPFEIALLLDTSGSTRADLELIRRAAQYFVDSLRSGDRVAIISFHTEVVANRGVAKSEVLVGLTDDRMRLRSALERVGTSNGTPFYDAITLISTRVFSEAPREEFRGRRALVALTDGVDSTSESGFQTAGDGLVNAGVTSFFIKVDTRPFFEENLLGDCESAVRFSQAQLRRYYSGIGQRSGLERTSDFCQLGDFERLAISKRLYEIADNEMISLSKLSGGRVFPVGDLSEARSAFRQVADEIGTKYSIGYYSSNEKRDGKFRSIRVEVRGVPSGAVVRAKQGYTANLD